MATYLNYDRHLPAENAHAGADRMSELVTESRSIILKLIKQSKTNLIAFSGGKDSIVTASIAASLGIFDSVTETSFTFEKAQADAERTADHFGLKKNFRCGLSWDWLRANPKYCAPPMKLQPGLYAIRQQRTVKTFSEKHGFTGVLFGRRRDENFVPSSLYQTKNGVWQCHPLINWTGEDIWTYIHNHNLPYPDLYEHEIGRKEGFTPYLLPPEHFTNVWAAIHDYEPAALLKLSAVCADAKNFLNELR